MANCNYYGTNGTSFISPLTISDLSNQGIYYTQNLNRMIWDLLPTYLRPYKEEGVIKRLRLFRLLQVIVSPISNIYSLYLKYVKDKLYESRISNSTIVLEKYLRDRFNDCGIYIVNNFKQIDIRYLYRKEEIGNASFKIYGYNPTEINPNQTYLFRKSEAGSKYSFTLYVPAYLISNGITTIQELNSILAKYVNICNDWEIILF